MFYLNLGEVYGAKHWRRSGSTTWENWFRNSCEVHLCILSCCNNSRLLGSLTTAEQANGSMFKPDMIYFTSSGSIGVIIDVADDTLSLHLTELQRNLAAVLPGVGGTSHARSKLLETEVFIVLISFDFQVPSSQECTRPQ